MNFQNYSYQNNNKFSIESTRPQPQIKMSNQYQSKNYEQNYQDLVRQLQFAEGPQRQKLLEQINEVNESQKQLSSYKSEKQFRNVLENQDLLKKHSPSQRLLYQPQQQQDYYQDLYQIQSQQITPQKNQFQNQVQIPEKERETKFSFNNQNKKNELLESQQIQIEEQSHKHIPSFFQINVKKFDKQVTGQEDDKVLQEIGIMKKLLKKLNDEEAELLMKQKDLEEKEINLDKEKDILSQQKKNYLEMQKKLKNEEDELEEQKENKRIDSLKKLSEKEQRRIKNIDNLVQMMSQEDRIEREKGFIIKEQQLNKIIDLKIEKESKRKQALKELVNQERDRQENIRQRDLMTFIDNEKLRQNKILQQNKCLTQEEQNQKEENFKRDQKLIDLVIDESQRLKVFQNEKQKLGFFEKQALETFFDNQEKEIEQKLNQKENVENQRQNDLDFLVFKEVNKQEKLKEEKLKQLTEKELQRIADIQLQVEMLDNEQLQKREIYFQNLEKQIDQEIQQQKTKNLSQENELEVFANNEKQRQEQIRQQKLKQHIENEKQKQQEFQNHFKKLPQHEQQVILNNFDAEQKLLDLTLKERQKQENIRKSKLINFSINEINRQKSIHDQKIETMAIFERDRQKLIENQVQKLPPIIQKQRIQKFENDSKKLDNEIENDFQVKQERQKKLQKLIEGEQIRQETRRQMKIQEFANKENQKNQQILNDIYEQPEYVIKQYYQQRERDQEQINQEISNRQQMIQQRQIDIEKFIQNEQERIQNQIDNKNHRQKGQENGVKIENVQKKLLDEFILEEKESTTDMVRTLIRKADNKIKNLQNEFQTLQNVQNQMISSRNTYQVNPQNNTIQKTTYNTQSNYLTDSQNIQRQPQVIRISRNSSQNKIVQNQPYNYQTSNNYGNRDSIQYKVTKSARTSTQNEKSSIGSQQYYQKGSITSNRNSYQTQPQYQTSQQTVRVGQNMNTTDKNEIIKQLEQKLKNVENILKKTDQTNPNYENYIQIADRIRKDIWKQKNQ